LKIKKAPPFVFYGEAFSELAHYGRLLKTDLRFLLVVKLALL